MTDPPMQGPGDNVKGGGDEGSLLLQKIGVEKKEEEWSVIGFQVLSTCQCPVVEYTCKTNLVSVRFQIHFKCQNRRAMLSAQLISRIGCASNRYHRSLVC